jgi:hypothetical protein
MSGRFRQIHAGHLATIRVAVEGLAAPRAMLFLDLFPDPARPANELASGALPPLEARARAMVSALHRYPAATPADADLLRLYHLAGLPSVAAYLRDADGWDPIRVSGSDVALRALASGRMAFEIGCGLHWAVVGRPGFDLAADQLPPGARLLPSSGFCFSSEEVFGTD